MSGQPISDIQEAALYWSQNGVDQCTNVSDPCDPGVDYNQCLKYPEATFLWYAITYLSDYIVEMMSGVQNCDVLGLNWADDKIGQFYTLPFNPDSDIEPISIAGGIFAALSTVIPPAAIGAGAASMLNGVLTEAGLNAIE